jgi:serine/threonine protein kinase/tetratricopeptide (TPR) repeat protein
MTPERYRQVGQLFHAALDLEPDEQAAFLEGACGGDQDLQREVESLLAAHRGACAYFTAPALEVAAELIPREEHISLIGRPISHYQILSRLGAGGMGEVYLAQDTRLGRKVAIKFLPRNFKQDQERVKRFEREARAISALNHPNIITIHEIGWAEERQFIVTEYVEGETLRQTLLKGPLRHVTALEIAIQVASALAAAHEVGMVHRDIKPENIMVRPDQLVKVLDFGLAKLTERRSIADESRTLTIALSGNEPSITTGIKTMPGLVMGTPQYMSPEQVRGGVVEAPSDIFSLGIVLFEMIAGNKPFTGETPLDVLAAILEKEVTSLARFVTDLPWELDRIVRKALAKRVEDRYQVVEDLRRELKNVLTDIGRDRETKLETRPERRLDQESQPIPPAEGERRQVAVICSSLNGYTAMVEQLTPDEVEGIVSLVRAAVLEIVQKYDGMVIRFTGEEMTALFGLPAIHEDDFVRAVKASLEIHGLVREVTGKLEPRIGQSIRLSTGISSGLVLIQLHSSGGNREEKYQVTGEALQIAARLAAQAEAGEILVGQEARRLISPFFRTEAGQQLSLKPKSSPIMTYRILGESGVQTRLEAAEVVGLTRYTGREKELASLQALYNKARTGEGQFVTIVGEAGAGKSRLLLEFHCLLKNDPGITILQGRCQSYGGDIPYQPFIDLLRDLLNLQESDDAGLLSRAISGIREIDPNLEIYIPFYLHLLSLQSEEHLLPGHLQSEDFRLTILEALTAIFTLRTRSGPAVIFLEDWHWADKGSDDALKKLVRMAADYPLVIVTTCRPECSFDWAYLKHRTHLYLGPLDSTPSISIMKSVFEADLFPEDLGDLLYRRTGGNPFFIEEICLTLIENGRVQVVDRAATLNGSLEEFDLPDTVQAVIRARLDRLDRETQRALLHASVIGQEFSRPILERTFESPNLLSRSLEKLQTLGLVHQLRVLPEASFRFNHMLTQEVVYESMLSHQRRSLHEAVGQAIEDLSRDRIEERLDLLVYHFSRAENWAKAIRYGRETAEKDARLIRFSEALVMLEKVEDWLLKLPASDERMQTQFQVLLQQERLCETIGRREQQQALIDRTLSLLDPVKDMAQLAEVYIRQGELYTLLRHFAEAEQVLSESLAIRRSLSDQAGESRALRSLGFLCWHQGRTEEAMGYHQSALELDRAMNDIAGYMLDLTNMGMILRARGEPEKALEYLKEAVRISKNREKLSFEVYALGMIAIVYRDLGEIDQGIEHLKQSIKIAMQNRMPVAHLIDMNNLVSLFWEQGREEEGLQICRELVSLARSVDIKSELAHALSVYGQRLLEYGHIEEARPILHEAVELFSQLGDERKELLILTNLARVYGQLPGGSEDCLATWGKIRDLRRERMEVPGEIAALKQMAKEARRAEDPALALSYYREACGLAADAGENGQEGDILNSMGIIEWEWGNYQRALEYYEQAYRIFEGSEAQIHAGLVLNSIAVTLKSMGRLDEAQSRLEEAIQVHRISGQKLFEGHALAALGDVLSDKGLLEKAAEHYHASLDVRCEIGDRLGEGWMLHHLARVYAAQGAPELAHDLLGQALAVADEIGGEQLKQACTQLRV